MNADLLRLLHRLALPGAVLVIRDYPVFNHYSTVLESPTNEYTVEDIVVSAMFDRGYLTPCAENSGILGKHNYTITDAGREALKGAEGEQST